MDVIDTSQWKEFRIGDLFDIVPTKGKNTYCLEDGSDLPYIAASRENNGVNRMISKDSVTDIVSSGNCLVFIHIGDAAAGYCHYIKSDFVGMAGKTSCAYLKNHTMTENIGLFFASIIRQTNEGRYSFGESWTGKRLLDTMIFLPSAPSGDPDWDYMDSFMGEILEKEESSAKQLAALAPETGSDGHFLDVSGWKAFQIGNLLGTAKHGNWIDPKSLDENESGYRIVSASTINNGASIERYSIPDEKYIVPAKVITWGKQSPFFAYQKEPTISGQGIYYYDVSQRTTQQALFLCGVMQSRIADKYNYQDCLIGCKCDEETIYLPSAPSGDPDWGWMEQYMQQQLDKTEKLAKHLNELN